MPGLRLKITDEEIPFLFRESTAAARVAKLGEVPPTVYVPDKACPAGAVNSDAPIS